MDVLFVDLPFNTYELGRKFKSAWSYKQFLSPYELHLGFRYMVAALRSRGHSADIAYPSPDTGILTKADLVRTVAEINPLVLGFTSYEGSLRESLAFIRRVKNMGVRSRICMGGHLATFSYREILRDFGDLVDVIVLGEGEEAIVEIVDAVKKGNGVGPIRGVAYSTDGVVVETDPRPINPDIDRLPFPVLPHTGRWRSDDIPLFLTTSRGCYGHCSFCRSSHFGERWRCRNASSVVDEMELACNAGVSTFEIVDDNFLGPGRMGKRRAEAVADEIERRGLQIRYHASCRVNDVNESTMRRLKASGLISVSLGVESGVQRMLDTFNKGVKVQQNLAALELLNKLAIPALAYVIFFDPYSTLAEARENLAFLKRIRAWDNVRFEAILFRKLIPISGTTLFERIRSDGLLRGNYLTGHHFVFRDSSVSVLADFMEMLDLRFERLLQHDEVRVIPGMYSVKESLEFHLMGKAIDLLAARRWKRHDALRLLDELLSSEVRTALGTELSEAGPVAVHA